MSKPESSDRIATIAREVFGYERLFPGQRDAIESVLKKRDTLVVKPTGSGKSAIYQIAGKLLDGPTIVVSPLISLQKDQVDAISETGAGDAAVLNSTQRVAQTRETVDGLRDGTLEYLLLAPEQLRRRETVETLQQARPSLFVVDEAHCISEWGHDFRPDYLKLGEVVEELGHPTVLAMTATAAPRVREEIVQRLGMKDPAIIIKGFDRPNIWLGVRQFDSEESKREALLEAVESAEKPAIIYVATRKNAEMMGTALSDRGLPAVWYHGGMPAKERSKIQEDFMGGNASVIVATSAFGMGIDKPDVRAVFHYDVSDSIDSYYQEIGRAGRDGKPARAVLFYRPENLSVQKFFKGGSKVEQQEIEQVAETLASEAEPLETGELKDKVGVSERKLTKALNRLEEVGAVEVLPTGEVRATVETAELDDAVREAAEAQKEHREYEQLRIEKMRAYAELNDCRREYLLNYFGEDVGGRCGYCDRCDAGSQVRPQAESKSADPPKRKEPQPKTEPAGPFRLKTRVMHKEWGKGVVESYEGDKIIVLFDEVGKKMLSLQTVMDHNLLERAT